MSHQAVAAGELRRVGDLLLAVRDLAESGSNFKHYESAVTALLDAAAAKGDEWTEARARAILAHLHCFMGRFREAEQEAHEAVQLGRSTGDSWTTADALNIKGTIALYQNRHGDGEEHLLQVIEHFRALGDRPGEASALCNLSRIHLATERTTSAVALAQQSIDIYDAMGNSLRGANARYALGLALTQSGELDSAADRLHEALEVFRDSRQRLWEGMSLFRLAEVDLAAQRSAQAATNAEMALSVLRGIGGDWRRGNILTVLGHALSKLGQTGRAVAVWDEALNLYEQLHAPEADSVRTLLSDARQPCIVA